MNGNYYAFEIENSQLLTCSVFKVEKRIRQRYFRAERQARQSSPNNALWHIAFAIRDPVSVQEPSEKGIASRAKNKWHFLIPLVKENNYHLGHVCRAFIS
jgi:hypothetical protein